MGEGIALKTLARPNFYSYKHNKLIGIELEGNKFKSACNVYIDQTDEDILIHADALNEVEVSRNSVGCLFLNPPYTRSMVKGDDTYYLFLKRYLSVLVNEGILILILPKKAYENPSVIDLLLSNFDKISIDNACTNKYNQIYFIGKNTNIFERTLTIGDRKYESFGQYKKAFKDRVELLKEEEEPIEKGSRWLSYDIPTSDGPKIKYTKLTGGKLLDITSGRLSSSWEALLRVNAKKDIDFKCLVTPREWHLTQAILSGALAGEVNANGQTLLIKGSTHKEYGEAEIDEDGKKTSYQRVSPCLIALDMTQGDNYGELIKIH